jgi:putative Mg2+ transporter-C (MgtC) family protein
MPDDLLWTAARLAFATLVGGAVGLNRDMRDKPAGVRTHAVVCLSTAAITLVMVPVGIDEAVRDDALSRVIQGIVTGIGFLGAGVILRNPGTHQITGLTTAATIWMTALLGVACGLGYYALVLLTIVFSACAVFFGGAVENLFRRMFPPRAKRDEARRNEGGD